MLNIDVSAGVGTLHLTHNLRDIALSELLPLGSVLVLPPLPLYEDVGTGNFVRWTEGALGCLSSPCLQDYNVCK